MSCGSPAPTVRCSRWRSASRSSSSPPPRAPSPRTTTSLGRVAGTACCDGSAPTASTCVRKARRTTLTVINTNKAPVAAISSPSAGTVTTPNSKVSLNGSASSAQGPLTGASLRWYASGAGLPETFLGVGQPVRREPAGRGAVAQRCDDVPSSSDLCRRPGHERAHHRGGRRHRSDRDSALRARSVHVVDDGHHRVHGSGFWRQHHEPAAVPARRWRAWQSAPPR